jgi:hypothetical protein
VRAAQLLRSLRHVGVVGSCTTTGGARAWVTQSLQLDFSLFATLALYLVEAAQASIVMRRAMRSS